MSDRSRRLVALTQRATRRAGRSLSAAATNRKSLATHVKQLRKTKGSRGIAC